MKIRNGFVSNSSSSSYIVKISGLDMEGFVRYLMSEYRWDFALDNIKNKIEENLEKCRKSMEEDSNDTTEKLTGYKELLGKIMVERISFLEGLKKTIEEKQDDVTLVETMLKFRSIESFQTENGIVLKYFTSMHNSFNEGMSDLLKEIVLFFIFDHKMKVICERESDQ